MPDEEAVMRADAAHEERLQRFKEAHITSRASSAQLEKIFNLNLNKPDQEKLLDWIEDPCTLYPLENQTLFDKALEKVRSESKARNWNAAVHEETMAEEEQVSPPEKVWKNGLNDKKESTAEQYSGPPYYHGTRRNAVVQAHFDEFIAEQEDGRTQDTQHPNPIREAFLDSQGVDAETGDVSAFVIARKKKSGPCSSIDEYASS